MNDIELELLEEQISMLWNEVAAILREIARLEIRLYKGETT